MSTYEITITSRFRGETVTTVFDTKADNMGQALIDAAFCARRVATSVDEVVTVSVEAASPAAIMAIALVA